MGGRAAWRQYGGGQGKHLRAPWGSGEARGKTISGREGRSQGWWDTPGLSYPQSLGSTPSPQNPLAASWWPRRWGEPGCCQGLGEAGAGFRQAQTQHEF